ncbi:oligosaccharide repeat unit polymerase [Sphingobacterium alimentarium]|uniref:Oligosaccharide repeat unit polymerase n=1 Tax=Sphingobacterium alimentarium TaxID=797292 RepID=A0A4R3VRI0_9SPHI|nr:DUF6337 family protein [Sphingobacterium alimentarium]TCV10491.1 oligosaccharide repeat unit polymerase [Sphingobacterium alimentarium]
MGLLLLTLLTIIIVLVDKKYHGTYYTPSVILSVPTLIIIYLYDLTSNSMGFLPLDYDVLFIWFYGLLVFWMVGLLSTLLIKVRPYEASLEERKKDILYFGKYLLNFSFILSLVLLYFVINAYFIYKSSGGDAAELYLGGGFQAHLTIVLKILSIISVLCLFSKGGFIFKLKNAFVISVVLGGSVLYATKSGLLILLISYFFAVVFFFKKKVNFLHIAFALFIGFLIFYISYSLVFGELADINFIWNHMILYYVCGVASMNAYFHTGALVELNPEFLFQSYFNVFYTLSGNSHLVGTVISDEWTYIGNSTTINVKTFFGTIYLYGGEYIGLLCIIIFSILLHAIFKLSKGKDSFFFLILYCFYLAVSCFGWFDFYFNSVATIESLVICLILNFIYKLKISRG